MDGILENWRNMLFLSTSKRFDWLSSRPILTLLWTFQAEMKITGVVGVPALKDHLALKTIWKKDGISYPYL